MLSSLPSPPRLRMFAGPNGSGKSTIKSVLRPELMGFYINPDEIEAEIRSRDFFDLSNYRVQTTPDEILPFFHESALLQRAGLEDEAHELEFSDGKLSFFSVQVNAYFASVAADFLRRKLLEVRASFTFETVMSSPDKVEFLSQAREMGYRNYLYYVATQHPAINISRVRSRVQLGGHPVPEAKIVSRYYRSLDLLSAALQHCDRAYFFDNSGAEQVWIAQMNGSEIEMKSPNVPRWFQTAVIDKRL